MKYNDMDEPADLEAAYRWIEKAGYGYALDPIKAHIATLEKRLDDLNSEARDEKTTSFTKV